MIVIVSFVDFEEPEGCQSSDGCKCSPQLPCGVNEGGHRHQHHHLCHLHHLLPHHVQLVPCKGDCDSKEDCQGNLICGKDNCEGEWFEDDDDCCVDIGIILGYCVVLVSTLSFKEDFQNPKR